jgi:hypothetical protein
MTVVFDVLRIAAVALLLTALGTYAMKLNRRDASVFDERHRLKPAWAAGALILVLVVVGDVISRVDQ